jgi:hypothetical protein
VGLLWKSRDGRGLLWPVQGCLVLWIVKGWLGTVVDNPGMVLTVVDGQGMVGGWSGGSPRMASESLGDRRGDESPTVRRWLVEGRGMVVEIQYTLY